MRIVIFITLIGMIFNPLSSLGQSELKINALGVSYPSHVTQVSTIIPEDLIPYHVSEYYRDKNTGITIKQDWKQHKIVNENALPIGEDPVLQAQEDSYKNSNNQVISTSFEGINYTGVKPADPCLAVGPEHILQVSNSQQGSVMAVYDKEGNVLTPPFLISQGTGIIGGGDPIVYFDHFDRRWVYMEMNLLRDQMILGISFNENPYGNFHVFTFDSVDQVDYPKISSWGDSYIITSHEEPLGLYAINKNMANVGNPWTPIASFSLNGMENLDFYSASPVHVNGIVPPPATSPPMIMRLVDDAWDNSLESDRLEIWTFDMDWESLTNSVLAGPYVINVAPFDTDLCGYNSYACVPQPNTNFKLDPVKEILMHQVSYRNFKTHESIVLTHTVDVNGTDKAGIRWYELRNSEQGWNLHQQGTYAPDQDHRFMGTININSTGDILLAYNVSGDNTYPSIRYTGRSYRDPLGNMTIPETSLMEGRASSPSNRWGDYNVMTVDPNDQESFWFNAMYTPKSEWSTRVGQVTFLNATTEEPLSIQLVDFDSKTDKNSIHVQWESQNADDFAGFELWRRSEYESSFTKMAFVPYKDQADLIQKYKYIDRDVNPNELYYYKLKMIDLVGEHYWSNVIIDKIESDEILPVTIFPNPTGGEIFVEVDKSIDRRDIVIEVFNMVGQKLNLDQKDNSRFFEISMDGLHPGIYIVRVLQRDKLLHIDRVSKI